MFNFFSKVISHRKTENHTSIHLFKTYSEDLVEEIYKLEIESEWNAGCVVADSESEMRSKLIDISSVLLKMAELLNDN